MRTTKLTVTEFHISVIVVTKMITYKFLLGCFDEDVTDLPMVIFAILDLANFDFFR